jgi:hypothetical protein
MGGCSVVLGIDNEYYAQGGDGGGGETGAASSVTGSSAEVSSSSAASGSGGDAAGSGGAGGGGGGAGAGAGGGPVVGCGNGVIDSGEECDDKNDASNTYCDDCQVDCPNGGTEHPTTHHCYVRSGVGPTQATASWDEAKTQCELLVAGAHLATLTTEAEINFIVSSGQKQGDAWVGATDTAAEGTFAWITGEPWTFAQSGGPWDTDEPNGSGDCLKVKTTFAITGKFSDGECNNNFPFYCEIPPAGEAP